MADDPLLNRMTETPNSKGDRLTEILNPGVGGEAGRLRNKLSKLYEAAAQTEGKQDSVKRMKARNAAIRLAKGEKPRRPDDPGVAESEPEEA